MRDHPANRGAASRARIDLEQNYGRRQWARRLRAWEEELRAAVRAVGRSADKVNVYLSQRGQPSR